MKSQLFLPLLLFFSAISAQSSLAASGGVLVYRPHAGKMRKTFSGKVEKYRYTLENQSKKPVTIVPDDEALDADNGCMITNYKKSEIKPGEKTWIDVACRWRVKGPHGHDRTAKITFEARPFGNRVLEQKVRIYSPLYFKKESDTCDNHERRICKGSYRKLRRLCFIGKGPIKDESLLKRMNDGLVRKTAEWFCGGDEVEKIYVKDSSEVTKKLEEIYTKSCDLVTEISFNDHGKEGYQGLGRSSLRNREDFEKLFSKGRYECMLATPSRVVFGGCSVGVGCVGKLLLSTVLSEIAPRGKEVEVRASTDYSVSILPRITSRTGSMNGKDLVVLQKNGKYMFSSDGVSSDSLDSVPQACAKECEEMDAKLTEQEDEVNFDSCTDPAVAFIWKLRFQEGHAFYQRCAIHKDANSSINGFLATLATPDIVRFQHYLRNLQVPSIKKVQDSCRGKVKPAVLPRLYFQKNVTRVMSEPNIPKEFKKRYEKVPDDFLDVLPKLKAQ